MRQIFNTLFKYSEKECWFDFDVNSSNNFIDKCCSHFDHHDVQIIKNNLYSPRDTNLSIWEKVPVGRLKL